MPAQRCEQVLCAVLPQLLPALPACRATPRTAPQRSHGEVLLQAADALMLSSVTGIDVKSAGQSQGDGGHGGTGDVRRHQRGHAEHRRHTIANGVDFSMVRKQPCPGLQSRGLPLQDFCYKAVLMYIVVLQLLPRCFLS